MTVASSEDLAQTPRAGFGSVEIGVEGRYDFSISDVLSEAWQKIDGKKGTLWLAIVFFAITVGVFSFIVKYLINSFGIGYVAGNPTLTEFYRSSIENLIGMVIDVPLSAGLVMISIKIAADAQVDWEELFNYFEKVVLLIGTTLLKYLLVGLGFCLLILPGIYLAVAYSMAIPLVIDKGLSPWEALETSRKAMTHNWFSFLGIGLLFAVILIVSAIPLGLGLIWTMPMGMLVTGILYRIMFGYDGEVESPRIAE